MLVLEKKHLLFIKKNDKMMCAYLRMQICSMSIMAKIVKNAKVM